MGGKALSILKQVTEWSESITKKPKDTSDKSDKSPSVSAWPEHFITKRNDWGEEELPYAFQAEQIRSIRLEGQIPDSYTSTTECKGCGTVPIWEGCPPEVDGCPWCFNRHAGLPIPRKHKHETD